MINIHTFSEIAKLNQTEEILKYKAKDIDKNFYHYTTSNSLRDILTADDKGNRFFFVRNIKEMNDLNEAELHKSEGDKIHSFCTCCTKYEKIPLWYLYSGICGNGARLGITPGKMLKFLNSIKTVYPVITGKVDYSKPLLIETDFDMMCGWVYYVMDGNNRVLYRNNLYYMDETNENEINECLFVKDYPWEYESEFRIVIKNKTDKTFDRIAIPFPKEIVPHFEIMSAPEHAFSKEERSKFISMGIKAERIKESRLKINMDLLRNNKYDILRQIDKWCEEEYFTDICSFVSSKKKCEHKGGNKF